MQDNSRMFKILLGFLAVIFGIFLIAQFSDSATEDSGTDTVKDHETFIGDDSAAAQQQQEEMGVTALEQAASDLCDCFTDLLELKAKVKDNPRLEFELSGKTKQAEIKMRKCYNSIKKKNMALGEDLFAEFEEACPAAQEEL